METAHNQIKLSTPSKAFEQTANVAAIAGISNPDDTLAKLIVHTLLTLDSYPFDSSHKISSALLDLYGIGVPAHHMNYVLEGMQRDKRITLTPEMNYILADVERDAASKKISESIDLQREVRNQWASEIEAKYPILDLRQAWDSLHAYLASAFLRHGIQVVAFLDPSIKVPEEYDRSLSGLLTDAIASMFKPEFRSVAREAVSSFMKNASQNEARARYIAECADGAYNYFSLSVDPEVAKLLGGALSPLTILCDTNFVFGLLNLHVHSQVEVSQQIVETIKLLKLPFKLRIHEATIREAEATIAYYGEQLCEHAWSQSISRAAINSPYVAGIELKYHQLNSRTPISPEQFLRPYSHLDVLLKDLGIEIYRATSATNLDTSDLITDYEKHLVTWRKYKPREAISHDMTLLACIRSIRNRAKSTLETGAIMISCDYNLFRYDSISCSLLNDNVSVVLPNVFWQILRPYIPGNERYEMVFAETFAIPEFRTIGSGSGRACSRMLGILASLSNIAEQTATRMLANDLLIDRLQVAESNEQFMKCIELAIADDNAILLQEKAGLEAELVELRLKEADSAANIQAKDIQLQTEISRVIDEKEAKIADIQEQLTSALERAKQSEQETEKERQAKEKAEEEARGKRKDADQIKRQSFRNSIIAALAIGLLLILVFEGTVYLLPWLWLRDNNNSYAIQALSDISIAALCIGAFIPKARSAWWIVVLTTAAIAACALLGGPKA